MTSRSALLEYVAKTVYWLILAASVWIFLRGHDASGGGFIGGLVAVAATGLVTIVYGVDSARRYLPLRPLQLAITGVLLSLVSGIPGMWTDAPFLTPQWWSIEFAGVSLKLSTVTMFDLGVYVTIWGAFTSYLFALLDDRGVTA
jgi:multicomponent Na+:H+ antiporter subunit B